MLIVSNNRNPFHSVCSLIRFIYHRTCMHNTEMFYEIKKSNCLFNSCVVRMSAMRDNIPQQRQIKDTGILSYKIFLIFRWIFTHVQHGQESTCLTSCQCPSRSVVKRSFLYYIMIMIEYVLCYLYKTTGILFLL